MADEQERFASFARQMRDEGLPEIVVRTFEHYYKQLAAGQTGLIAESEIEPVESLPDAETLDDDLAQIGQEALKRTVFIKLNGGLGTSMGLERAKSLLEVKKGLTFIDVIARQALHAGVPLVLMNSFKTHADTLAALEKYPELEDGDLPLDFVQHKVPKVRQNDLLPAEWPDEPELAWCPPGHGDIYTALVTSGMLRQMLEQGYEYAFVSNSDNLGAVLEPRILGYFASNQLPFMMEVADRTLADRKGGHLARTAGGQLLLRESAQCPDEDLEAFQNVDRHRYFNTNNLWLHLPSLQRVLEEREQILGLPMIRNRKTVDPRNRESYGVYQLETAMGSAIAVFEGAGAIRVTRSRFAPVKTTNDMLAVRSDAYVLSDDDYRIVMAAERQGADLVIDLDPGYYKQIDQMEARFPYGAPSLIECQRLHVRGDVLFGDNVAVKGQVKLVNSQRQQAQIDSNTVLDSDLIL